MLKKRGFTLVELLISISIIAILSAIGLISYSIVMKQGRDSKRQSDLRSIQSALEEYYADQKFYPTCLKSSPSSCGDYSVTPNLQFTNSTGNLLSPSAPYKTYMSSLPADPTNNSIYIYKYIGINDGSAILAKYCLFATLENPPSSTPTPPIGCIPPSGYNFVLAPP